MAVRLQSPTLRHSYIRSERSLIPTVLALPTFVEIGNPPHSDQLGDRADTSYSRWPCSN